MSIPEGEHKSFTQSLATPGAIEGIMWQVPGRALPPPLPGRGSEREGGPETSPNHSTVPKP